MIPQMRRCELCTAADRSELASSVDAPLPEAIRLRFVAILLEVNPINAAAPITTGNGRPTIAIATKDAAATNTLNGLDNVLEPTRMTASATIPTTTACRPDRVPATTGMVPCATAIQLSTIIATTDGPMKAVPATMPPGTPWRAQPR